MRIHLRVIWFITYEGLPELDPDDQLAAEILRERGYTVVPKIWDDKATNWDDPECDLAIVRSTWDYHRKYGAFRDWLSKPSLNQRLQNPPALMLWNSNKKYLRELEQSGVSIVPTLWFERGTSVQEVKSAVPWTPAIIKPTVGLATSGVGRLDDFDETVLDQFDCMVQPYMREIETSGERALIFINGEYSHAIRKAPFQSLAAAGHAGECVNTPSPDEIDFARQALFKVKFQSPPLYARVDIVRNHFDCANPLCVMELELLEPSLFFRFDPQNRAAARFADAIETRLSGNKEFSASF